MTPLIILATSALLRWHQGEGLADSIRGFRSFDGTHASMQPANLWSDSLRTVRKMPRQTAGWDSGWCYRDDDWRSPLRYYVQIGAISTPKLTLWGDPSNDIITAVGERWAAAGAETTYYLRRGSVFTDPVASKSGFVNWSLAPGDVDPVQVVTSEYVYRTPANLDFGCMHFFYWYLRGVVQPCGPAPLGNTRRIGDFKAGP